MFVTSQRVLWALCVAMLANSTARAGEPAAQGASAVADLIKQLDADEFGRREEASRRLTDLGVTAVPELAAAVRQPSLEVRTRAFAILKKFEAAEDVALHTKARQALKDIAALRDAAEKNHDDALASAAVTAKAMLGRPFLGLLGAGRDDAMVGAVVDGSPAEKAGLKPGDVVLSFAGTQIQTFANLIAAVANTEPGDHAKVEINRDGETKTIDLTVGRYPAQPVFQQPGIQFVPDAPFDFPVEE